jgi:DNA-binding SARP family transcriptional activator
LYFTQQFDTKEKIFLFHPLFRAFLLDRGEKQFSSTTLVALQKRAADLLQDNHTQAAYDLYLACQSYDDNIHLICQHAPVLLQQGRFQTLQQWIVGLPENFCKQAPWVLYWQGVSLTFQNPLVARQTLEQAYAVFIERGETIGAILACSGIIDTFPMLWDNFRLMDPWIDRLEALLNNAVGNIPPELEYRITNSMLIGYSTTRTGHPDTKKWLTRGKQAIQSCSDPFIRSMIFQYCFYLEIWSGNSIDSQLLLENTRSAMTGEASIPMSQIWWHMCECIQCWNNAETDKAIASAETALQLADATGVHVMDVLLHYQAAMANLTTGRLDAGRHCIESIHALIVPGQLMNEVCYYQAAGILAWHEGNLSRASICVEKAVELCNQAGIRFAIGLNSIGYALILFEQGQTDDAHTLLAKTRQRAQSDRLEYMLFEADLFLAYFSFIQGNRQTALQALESAMVIGAKSRRIGATWWHPTIMSLLCSEALYADIETDYVCEMIRRRQLAPHSTYPALQNWPWPVRIHTFGGLRITIDNEPVDFEGKPQSKPMELLAALITFGATNVERSMLADTLWPSADGNDALESFKTTLRRLRKLLHHEQVLPLQNGKLSLNKNLCWLDTWAFTNLVNDITSSDEMDSATIQHTIRTLMQVYTSSFLGSEGENAWSIQTRQQLRNSFIRAVVQIGQDYESTHCWQQAIDCYEQALHAEELAEVFYQRLIVCYHKTGLTSEALNSYKRCEALLENKQGIQPSAKTLELIRAVKPDL